MKDTASTIAIGIVAVTIGVILFSYADTYFLPTITQSGSNATTSTPSTGPVLFTELAHGSHSTVARRTNYIITSSSELTELWKMIEVAGQPPVIDFEKDEVIAVFAGKEPNAGYEIKVSQIEDSSVRKVTLTLTVPGGSCLLAESITNPYQVIMLPKTTLDLAHEDQTMTVGCLH